MTGDVRIFEIGSVFTPRKNQLPAEELRVAALVMGRRQPPHFTDPKSPEFDAWVRYSEWDAKALARLIGETANPGASVELRDGTDGSLWDVYAGERRIGAVRQVALDAPVWASAAFGVELSLGSIDSADVAPRGTSAYREFERSSPATRRYEPIASTPASEFDLALLVPDSVKAEQVELAIERVAGKLLERIELFDRYVGQGVEPGTRSLAWRLTFRHAERTLRDKEIDARRSDILKALADELNVRQRSN
jgi:phenylalanyl-tRNA synthetase beta chain